MLTGKRAGRGGSTLEVGNGAALQPLAELVDALGGVGALPARVEAAKLIPSETAKQGSGKVQIVTRQ